jgi:hypothetical protein
LFSYQARFWTLAENQEKWLSQTFTRRLDLEGVIAKRIKPKLEALPSTRHNGIRITAVCKKFDPEAYAKVLVEAALERVKQPSKPKR